MFGEGSKQQVFLSSADWMPRNFDRRVEVMFPVEAEDLRQRIVDEIIPAYLQDNRRARYLNPDGTYTRAPFSDDMKSHRSQVELLSLAAARAAAARVAEESPPVPYEEPIGLNGAPTREGKRRLKKKNASRR